MVNRTRGCGSLSVPTQSLSVQAGRGQGNFSVEQLTGGLKTLRTYRLINCPTEHFVEGRGMNLWGDEVMGFTYRPQGKRVLRAPCKVQHNPAPCRNTSFCPGSVWPSPFSTFLGLTKFSFSISKPCHWLPCVLVKENVLCALTLRAGWVAQVTARFGFYLLIIQAVEVTWVKEMTIWKFAPFVFAVSTILLQP